MNVHVSPRPAARQSRLTASAFPPTFAFTSKFARATLRGVMGVAEQQTVRYQEVAVSFRSPEDAL
jgi:hypothetical protein